MVPFRMSRRAVLAAAPVLAVRLGGGTAAAAESDFSGFLAELRRAAAAQGIRAGTIDLAFRYIQYLPHVVELDQRQPEHKLTFPEYFRKVVTQQRLDDARQHLVDNWQLLQRVRQSFNVQPRFVVALWGVESDFGRTMGDYSVPAALATLAYEGRRGEMFRAELLAALKILDHGDIRADHMVGSWAGAMGQCQFMPTTFLRYAVDFDGDGRRDIWTDRSDVLGSIANYLSHLGWRGNEDWGRRGLPAGQFRHEPRRTGEPAIHRGMGSARRAPGRCRRVHRARATGLAGRAGRHGRHRLSRLRQFPRHQAMEQLDLFRGRRRLHRRQIDRS